MTENNTKLFKTCSTARKIVKVIRIFSYVAAVLLLMVAVALAVPGFIDMDQMVVEHTMTGAEVEWGKIELAAMFAAAFGVIVITGMIFLLCEKVLASVRDEGSPFVAENVSRIKGIAILTAISGVIPSFLSQVVLLISGLINGTGADIVMEVEISYLVMALVIWCVALIFEYGVTLQQRDDETL